MLARFSHGCQNSDTRKLSSSRTVNLRQKSSYTRCNREAHKWRTHPSCKIIQQQPQRYSHKSNGRGELLMQTIRNQIKAYKIKSEKNIGITIEADSSLLTWLPRRSMAVQAIPQTTILNDNSVREDSNTKWYGSKRCVEPSNGKSTLGHFLPKPWCATHGHQQKSREEDH